MQKATAWSSKKGISLQDCGEHVADAFIPYQGLATTLSLESGVCHLGQM